MHASAEAGKARIEAALQSIALVSGGESIRFQVLPVSNDAALMQQVWDADSHLNLSGMSFGFNVKGPGNLGYREVIAQVPVRLKDKVRLFGVELPKQGETSSAAGLFIVGTMTFSDALMLPKELQSLIVQTDSGFGFRIFLVRPQPLTPQLAEQLKALRSVQISA